MITEFSVLKCVPQQFLEESAWKCGTKSSIGVEQNAVRSLKKV
jgi:hypothetical protein